MRNTHSLHQSHDGQLAPLLKSLQSNVAPLKRCPMARTTKMCISCKHHGNKLAMTQSTMLDRCHMPLHFNSHMQTLT